MDPIEKLMNITNDYLEKCIRAKSPKFISKIFSDFSFELLHEHTRIEYIKTTSFMISDLLQILDSTSLEYEILYDFHYILRDMIVEFLV